LRWYMWTDKTDSTTGTVRGSVCVCVYVGIMYVSFVCMRVCVVFVLVYTGLRFVCEVMR